MGNNESQIRDDDINLHKKMTQDASNGETIRYGEFDQLFMRFDDNNSDSHGSGKGVHIKNRVLDPSIIWGYFTF